MHGMTDDRREHTHQTDNYCRQIKFVVFCCCCCCFRSIFMDRNGSSPSQHWCNCLRCKAVVRGTRRANDLAAWRLWSDDNNDCDDGNGGCLAVCAFECICVCGVSSVPVRVFRCFGVGQWQIQNRQQTVKPYTAPMFSIVFALATACSRRRHPSLSSFYYAPRPCGDTCVVASISTNTITVRSVHSTPHSALSNIHGI